MKWTTLLRPPGDAGRYPTEEGEDAKLNPYEPSDVDEALVAIEPDYTRLRRVIAGLSVFHAVWLSIVLVGIDPRLVERNAFMLVWELISILFGILLAFRMHPVRSGD